MSSKSLSSLYDEEDGVERKPSDVMNVRLSQKATRRESARRASGRVMLYALKPEGDRDETTARWVDDEDDFSPKTFWVEDKSQAELREDAELEEVETLRKRQQDRKLKGLFAFLGCIVCALLAAVCWMLVDRFILEEESQSIGSDEDPIEKFDRPASLPSSSGSSSPDTSNSSDDFVCDGRVKLGNEVLTATSLDREVAPDETVLYQCTFRNLWTKERQPISYPTNNPSWIGPFLWTGPSEFVPLQEEGNMSPGAQGLVENGFTSTLVQEMNDNNVFDFVDNPTLTVDDYFTHLPPLRANARSPFLSLMASMEPSPQWFSGFYSYALLDDYNVNVRPQWKHHIKIQVYPWQGGTTARRITNFKLPSGPSELKNPDGDWVPPVGELECFLTGEDAPEMPDCDFYADPCCKEGTPVCDNVLPNGMLLPELSCATQEVLYYRENPRN